MKDLRGQLVQMKADLGALVKTSKTAGRLAKTVLRGRAAQIKLAK